jgi:[ribosomal protein S18]-alanine N-acetyltransferase
MMDPSSKQQVRPMTVDEAEQVAAWRYSGGWSIYNLESAQSLIVDLSNYYSIIFDGNLIGFCCIGEAARVPGMTEEPATLDLGVAMDPVQVGRGHGAAFGQVVLNFLSQTHLDKVLRAVVQSWNERSLQLTRRLGFEDAGELNVVQGGRPVSYRVVIKHPHQARI